MLLSPRSILNIPNYSDLYSIYENTVKDSEVITQMQNATDKLEAEPFAVAIDGVDDDELTKLFKKSWFTDFLWCCFEYDLWGYTVAEAGPFLGQWPVQIVFNLFAQKHFAKPTRNFGQRLRHAGHSLCRPSHRIVFCGVGQAARNWHARNLIAHCNLEIV